MDIYKVIAPARPGSIAYSSSYPATMMAWQLLHSGCNVVLLVRSEVDPSGVEVDRHYGRVTFKNK